MTFLEARQNLTLQLKAIYPEDESGNIAELVMEHITGWSRMEMSLNRQSVISPVKMALLQSYAQQLREHKPVQYVLNEAWFAGMKLYVDESVLIPRPETEELVDWIVKENSAAIKSGEKSAILDIGTGSGCIPLGLKKNLGNVIVSAIDISSGALQVARKNAASENLDIYFSQVDILSPEQRDELAMYDIIVSNPPYIPVRDKDSMRANVLNYEPWLALFVENDDPLCFYKAISSFGLKHLNTGGIIYLEMHEDLAEAVVTVFIEDGYINPVIKKDMQGKDRMAKFSAPFLT